jgi:hypothetical protein
MVQTMQLPRVQTCDATQCGYNHDGCHAFAITIGGAGHASCDTFFATDDKGGLDLVASVGACKRTDCTYNRELECHAPAIQVAPGHELADCVTYRTRS